MVAEDGAQSEDGIEALKNLGGITNSRDKALDVINKLW